LGIAWAQLGCTRLTVRVPDSVPAEHRPVVRAVVRHCTVQNTLDSEPSVTIELD